MRILNTRLKLLITVCFILGLFACDNKIKIEMKDLIYKFEAAYIWEDKSGEQSATSVRGASTHQVNSDEFVRDTTKVLEYGENKFVKLIYFTERETITGR